MRAAHGVIAETGQGARSGWGRQVLTFIRVVIALSGLIACGAALAQGAAPEAGALAHLRHAAAACGGAYSKPSPPLPAPYTHCPVMPCDNPALQVI